ncbi:MAG: glutamate synthase subunit beta [Anaerolineae bacterium]|nr:glutamate synthase subunit beta [Anaerolineae bacterium]
MAKPTGFLEFQRELPEDRPIDERLKDWEPIHLHMPDGRLQNQAARCMDCGTPFCHTGKVINNMASGCPINNLIPEWNDLVYQGLWREAYDRLNKTNNFPEFTGLVCPAPCEAACTLGIIDPAVTIKSIEYAIIDKAFAEGWVTPDVPETRTGKKVAVIGSGPSGLACADQLNTVGHEVTVFERADRIGGLLMYGIPNMKLDKEIIQRRLDVMAEAGIIFRPNTEIGSDIPAEQLKEEFDAIVICTGATRPRDLPAEGRSAQGIHYAMDFLHGNTKQLLDGGGTVDVTAVPISAQGKDVIVIGGGDTGTDCVATSLRQGCNSLVQFEIMPQPPAERAPDNPWPQWPKVYKLDYGQEEAAAVYGEDPRTYCILTKRFVKDEDGNLAGVDTVEIEWVSGENGRPQLREVPGTEKRWPAQLVLLAMGFLGPESPVLTQLDVEQDERSNAKAQYGKFKTSVDGVFAAGDARRGQSLVVWAINEGRGAARAVDKWLMGETDLP